MRGDSSGTLVTPLSQRAMDVLHSIESQESTWVIKNYRDDHSYGRVPGEDDLMYWSVPASTGLFLYSLLIAKKPKRILEIGTSAGYSTIWMAMAVQTYGGHLVTVDLCPEKVSIARQNFDKSGVADVVTIIQDDAVGVMRRWSDDDKVDFVFLDADKENYGTYLNEIRRFISDEGILCGDNAIDYRDLMQEFIVDARKMHEFETVTLPFDNGIFLMSKKLK